MKRVIKRGEQDSDDILMSGKLLKKSDHLKQWRERWFWLTADGCMHYAKSEQGLRRRVASGTLGAPPQLTLVCEISKQSQVRGSAAMWRFNVRMATSSSKSTSSSSCWQLSAASADEREEWATAIHRLSEPPPASSASSPSARSQERSKNNASARSQQQGAGGATVSPKTPAHVSSSPPAPPPTSSPQALRTPSKAESNRNKRRKRQEYVERVQQLRFFDGSGRGTAEDGEPMTRSELQGTYGSDLGSTGLGLLRMTWRRSANNSSTLIDDRRHSNLSSSSFNASASDLGFDDTAAMGKGPEPSLPAARAANTSLHRSLTRKPAAAAPWDGKDIAAPAQRSLFHAGHAVPDHAFEAAANSLQLYVVAASWKQNQRVCHLLRDTLSSKKLPLLGFLPGGRVDDDYKLHMSALQFRVNDDIEVSSSSTFDDHQIHLSAPEAIRPDTFRTPSPSFMRSHSPTPAHGRSRSRSGSSGRLLTRQGSRSRLEALIVHGGNRVRSSSFGSSRSRSNSRSWLGDRSHGPPQGDDIKAARPRADSRSQIEDLFGDGAAGGSSSGEDDYEGEGPNLAKISLSV